MDCGKKLLFRVCHNMLRTSFYYLRVSMKTSRYGYRKKSYRSTLDAPVQVLSGGGGVTLPPARNVHYIGGWVGLGAGLEEH